MNKFTNWGSFLVLGEKINYYQCEYTLKEVINETIMFTLVVIFLSWWCLPLVYLNKLYNVKKPHINWPVFRCKK